MTQTELEELKERKEARRLYMLSLWSPLLILIMVGLCHEPAVFFILVAVMGLALRGATSKYAFVRWHSQQWAVLTLPCAFLIYIGLALNSYSLSVGVHSKSGALASCVSIGLMIPVSVSWYLANILGLWQVNHGR